MARPRIAIVTGGDSGIGKASAVALAAAGHDIGITWHRDEEGAQGAADEITALGRAVELRQVDLERLPGSARVLDELAAALGGVDVLVNNAGTGIDSPFVEQSFDHFRHVLAVDLEAPFVLAQHAARLMIDQQRGGSIINITSVHEHVPLPGAAAYCAAKGGLGLLTKVMALELAPYRIRVNSVAPGEIATPMTGQHDVDVHEHDRPRIPWGRPGDAREIAATVVFLVSAGASYITGASLVADGGLTLMAAVR